jgi:hypothetical protein
MKRLLPFIQGWYYLITGIWPMVHMASFMAVTGPKIDVWLVKMVALLSISIGISILAARRDNYNSFVLNGTAAFSYFAIDTWYALTGRISPVYLGDAVVELAFLILIILIKTKPKLFI